MNTEAASADKIIIRGARQHNLKNIDIVLPRNQFVVITGLSGSGKSSLAFDTLYAEGQRRYVESLSAYARQFLGQMEKPDVDQIEGLSPAVSIDQKGVSHNPRSTVGTITEIYQSQALGGLPIGGTGSLAVDDLGNVYVWIVFSVTLVFGAVGWVDDYRKVIEKDPRGLPARWKYFWQSVGGLGAALALYWLADQPAETQLFMPFVTLLESALRQQKPGYEAYMQRTSAFFPRPPRG